MSEEINLSIIVKLMENFTITYLGLDVFDPNNAAKLNSFLERNIKINTQRRFAKTKSINI